MLGKILIQCDLIVKTGMHIGGSSAFSAIGAVDSPVVRDPYSGFPIIPGSSLKGKLRYLLAKSLEKKSGSIQDHREDDPAILSLFGCAAPKVLRSKLQFSDCFVSNAEQMKPFGLTEVKFENTINRRTSVANPRQIERINVGTVFAVRIVYDVTDDADVEADMRLLAKGLKLLQLDYLGGHGSRGSGRVSFQNIRLLPFNISQDDAMLQKLQNYFQEVEDYELFSV